MRIAFLMYDTLLGGTEQASLRLMQAMRERGDSFEVLSLTPAGPMKDVLVRQGIACTDMPRGGKGGWRNLLRLVRAIRTMRPDAVILANHNPVATLAAALARVPMRVQLIHSYHRGLKWAWEWKLIYWLSYLCQQRIVFVSRFIRDEAVALLPRLASRSTVIHNIAPPARLISAQERTRARAALGLPPTGHVIGNAGRHVPIKRFDVFLEVAARVATREPLATFVVAGGGPQTESLKTLAARLGIADRVRWLPWLASMDDFYAAIDVLLFNSDIDALGLMAVEAMACGIPVVASVAAGGLRELIESDLQGCLLGSHDVDELAQRVLSFLGPQGAIVGAAGRERSQRYGPPAEIAGKMAQVLETGRMAGQRIE